MTYGAGLSRPETHFVDTPRGAVAYQVFGDDERDLLFLTHWLTNVDAYWDEPTAVRYFDRLGSMGRVILTDKLATGVSDMPIAGVVTPIEDYLDEILAVLDEVGSERPTLIGDTEGGMLAMMLAATYPDRFPRLVLINSYPRLRRADDYEIGAPDSVIASMREGWIIQHGTTGEVLTLTAPSVADDPRFRAWWVRFQRASQKPRVAANAIDWIAATDVRAALGSIQAETLIIHRRDAQFHRLEYGQYLAEHIDGARLEIVEGADTLPFHAGDLTPTLDLLEHFVTGAQREADSHRMLSTVLFTDIVGSTALAAEYGDQRWLDIRSDHDRIARESLARFRGQEVKMTGDGTVATFDGPQRAVLCAMSMREGLANIGVNIRAGLHTGEVEMRDGELGGLAVHIASRVMGAAESGGILVSSTVKDLVVGSRLEFDTCGSFELKGVPGTWNLYEARGAAA